MEIKVKVIAGAYKELVCPEEGYLEIYVKEPPAGNMANKRVRQLVARHAGVPIEAVHLVRGQRSRSKVFEVNMKKPGLGERPGV